jgi:hypothetical protein
MAYSMARWRNINENENGVMANGQLMASISQSGASGFS